MHIRDSRARNGKCANSCLLTVRARREKLAASGKCERPFSPRGSFCLLPTRPQKGDFEEGRFSEERYENEAIFAVRNARLSPGRNEPGRASTGAARQQ